ncbi:hypothetical protein RJ639_034375 [Escallonia herrerae]|uniref:Uncharacterized protein n=1 Tax=Escallonia herrerae TaxID=1293975 RepID=A0AA88WV68_9ASTE|nr:hypothetical protein RJ639_034375 [Escallonia herrerae]
MLQALLSLNGIDDVKARVLSKVEHKLSSRRRLTWDVNFTNFVIIFPWKDTNLELHKVVLESRAISFASKREVGFFDSDIDDKSCVMRNFIHAISASDIFMGFQLQDLYDHFDIKLVDVEMKMSMPYCGRTVPILEKFSASIAMASCIIPDESMLNGLEVRSLFGYWKLFTCVNLL